MAQGYELNLRDYWNIFLKRKWLMILSLFVVVGASVVYTNVQPLLYRASAMIKIEPTMSLSRIFPERYFRAPDEISDYEQQIRSRPIIVMALKELGITNDDMDPEESDYKISEVASGLSTSSIEKTNMIRIEMVSQDPKTVAVIVNKIVEVFKSENIKQKNQQIMNVREFVESQLKLVSDRLKDSVEKVNELTLKGVGSLATSLTEKIIELESRRSDLLTTFTELHPNVIKIDEQMAFLREQLKTLPKEEFEYSNLRRESAINEKLYNLLREKLQEVQIKESEKVDNIVMVSPAFTPHTPFSPNKPANYFVGVILGVIFGTSVGLVFEHLDTSIGRIEDLENITKISVIGVIPYYTKGRDTKEEFRKNRMFFRPRLNAKEIKNEKIQSKLITTHRESSIFLEAFRILGANTQVVFGEGEKIKNKCILITSSNPEEGKSIISSNLGIIMAQMGYKTVLVDTDLRRANVHKLFGLRSKDRGVTDVLTGEIKLEEAIRTSTDLLMGEMSPDDLLKNPWMDGFHLITAGTTFPNSPYLLNTEKMDRFIRDLKSMYDVVIMDSSPVLAVSDTLIIVPKTDGVILVYRAGATSRISLRRAKMQIESTKSAGCIKGIILNNVTPEVSMDTYYYYYRKKYYIDKEEEKKVA